MSKTTPFDIYKLLDKSNCRKCGKPTCMAFAAVLISGEADIDDCPGLDDETKTKLRETIVVRSPKEDMEKAVEALRKDVASLDFIEVADQLGARVENGRLVVFCLGKDFVVNPDGTMESQCHVNPWVEAMLFTYCTSGGKGEPSGRWVSFGELGSGAAAVAAYFERRVEQPLKYVADEHYEIFWDLLDIFDGKPVEGFSADHAWMLYPLPKVPFLILYTRAEDEFESRLRVLLDGRTAEYLRPEAITYTGRGMVEMFKRIIARHQEHNDTLLFV
jgi:hypothetical protein